MKRVSWATKHRSDTGKIVRWSKHHFTADGETALCGVQIPRYTKQAFVKDITAIPVQGRRCRRCYEIQQEEQDL